MLSHEYIIRAAIHAMIHQGRDAHCYTAWVKGEGYTNKGTDPATRADYLRQLERAATSELENMGYATGYAEPGYTDPKRGILFADWNVFPRGLDTLLERAGYAIGWSDEWSVCECGKACRTSPDGHDWKPSYNESMIEHGEFLCLECAPLETEEEEEEEETPTCFSCGAEHDTTYHANMCAGCTGND